MHLNKACTNGIIECAKREKGGSGASISADDLLPIFIYAVAHANLRHHHSILTFLLHTTPRHVLMTQTGYSLTMFESALFFILNLEGPWDEAEKEIRIRNERLHSNASANGVAHEDSVPGKEEMTIVDESTAVKIVRASSVKYGGNGLVGISTNSSTRVYI